jgi:plastocyanin
MKKNIHFIIILVLIILAALYFFAYKKDDSGSSINLNYEEPEPGFFDASLVKPNDIVIRLTEEGFEPSVLNINQGEVVTFVNETDGYAWPASDPHPTHTNYSSESPGFDPELPMKVNQAWAFKFEKIGNWKYHDHLDPSVRGIVNVE